MKVRYSQADPVALSDEIGRRYDLKSPVSCQLHRKGMSDVYKITAGDAVYYLKNYLSGVHSFADYEQEAHIINSLIETGVSAAAPVTLKDGGFVWQIDAPEGVRCTVMFAEAKEAPSGDGNKKSFALGRALANMHAVSDAQDFKISRPPIDFAQLIDEPIAKLRPHLQERNPDEYAFITAAMEDLRKYISERLTTEKPYYGFCHGDVQYGNVCYNGDEPTFFDFDTMGYGWRVHDIAVHVFNVETFINPAFRESDEGKAFFDGYNSVRQLTQNEMACINAFAAIRAIWALGINIDLLRINGFYSAVPLVDYLAGVFKTWHGKVIAGT